MYMVVSRTGRHIQASEATNPVQVGANSSHHMYRVTVLLPCFCQKDRRWLVVSVTDHGRYKGAVVE